MPQKRVLECMLTIDEVADALSVSTRTIRRWIGREELIAHQLGRQWRIAKADLEEHLRRHRRGRSSDVL